MNIIRDILYNQDSPNYSSVGDYINECLHPEIFSGQIPVHPRNYESPIQTESAASLEPQSDIPSWEVVYYDAQQQDMFVLGEDTPENAEYNPRYTMMGLIINVTSERRRGGKRWVRILSPYMLMVEADPSVIKNPKKLEKKLRESVDKEMSEFRARLGAGMKDVQLDIMNQQDVEVISDNLQDTLMMFDHCSSWVHSPNGHTWNLLTENNLAFKSFEVDPETAKLSEDITIMLGGFGPDYNKLAMMRIQDYEEEYYRQSEYHQLDMEEFLQRSQSPALIMKNEEVPLQQPEDEEKKESLCMKVKWTDLTKLYKGVNAIDICVPIMMRVEIN